MFAHSNCNAAPPPARNAFRARGLAALILVVTVGLTLTESLWAADLDPQKEDAATEYLAIVPSSDRRILSALDQPVAFTFVDTPLVDFVDELNEKSGFHVQLDLKALDDAGISSETPINCRLKATPLRSALHAALSDVGAAYYIQDGILFITGRDVAKAEENLSTRLYPIGDFAGDDFETIMDAITETVAKNSWEENGGQGKIEPAVGSQSLIISQTDEVQTKVLGLLRALRTAHKLWPRESVRKQMGHVGQGMM